MTRRTQPVVQVSDPRRLAETLHGVLGKMVSLGTVELLKDLAGYQIINAATAPGTDIPEARTQLDFSDAGIDTLRLVVRGKNSAAGSVTVQVYRVSDSLTLASVVVTNNTLATFAGSWTILQPLGDDEDIGLRVVGDGAFDPILYRVDLQMRTTQRRL